MAAVRETGRALFGDNCAVCHGRKARGSRASPTSRASSFCGATRPRRSPRPSGSASTRPMPRAACRRCRRSAAIRCWSGPISRTLSPMCSACPAPKAGGRQCRGRQDRLHGELRGLSRAGRQGQDRGRRARPHQPRLDPWRRRSVDLQRRVGRPAGTDAELGRPAVAGRPQDPRPLCRRPREAAAMSALPSRRDQDPHGRRPFAAGGLAAAGRRQCAPRLRGGDVATRLRRSRPARAMPPSRPGSFRAAKSACSPGARS